MKNVNRRREPVTHYQPRPLDPHASCGRDVLGHSSTTDPNKSTCRLCSTHPDVKRAKAAAAKAAESDQQERTDNA